MSANALSFSAKLMTKFSKSAVIHRSKVGNTKVSILRVESLLSFYALFFQWFERITNVVCKQNIIRDKDREAFRTLVESLVQMTTFISRFFLLLVELQFKVLKLGVLYHNFSKHSSNQGVD